MKYFKSTILVLTICSLFSAFTYLQAHDLNEEDNYELLSMESMLTHTGMSIAMPFGILGNHLSPLGLEIRSPFFWKNQFAFSLYATGYIVNGQVHHPKYTSAENYSDDYRYYQIFGAFRLSFIAAYNSEKFKAYSKLGVNMIMMRDSSWKDYYNVIANLPKVNDTETDYIFGIASLIGFEFLFDVDGSKYAMFMEMGIEYFHGQISPETSALESIINTDTREVLFSITIGPRYYFW